MTSLIVRHDAQLAATVTPQAVEMRDLALACAALIGKVANEAEQKDAVEAQKALQAYEDAMNAGADEMAEAPWKLFKAVRKVQADSKAATSPELLRVSTLIGDFQSLEQSKRRAAANAVNSELSEFERQKAEALSKATTHEERDAINDHFGDLVAQTQMTTVQTEAPRVEGQRITQDWAITITDIHALYRFHSQCCELKPRMAEIKALLNDPERQGPVRGITAERKIKCSARPTKAEAIQV